MRRQLSCNITFVTGTDTGVGKTVFTAYALHHLRQSGTHALALKPFCSGSRCDAEYISEVQEHELPLDTVNPFYFPEPVAPLLGARLQKRRVTLRQALTSISAAAKRCEHLVVEGAGGLLAPLGEGFDLLDLMRCYQCEIIIVAANRLGVVNHLRLTYLALTKSLQRRCKIVLMQPPHEDESSSSNAMLLRECTPSVPCLSFPWLGPSACSIRTLDKKYKKIQKTLADVF